MSKKIYIFGQGQLGTYYKDYFKERGYNIANDRVEIRDFNAVKSALKKEKPDFVINTAAKTNLDWCEKERLECFDINTLGADTVARACQELGIYLVHLSSGCVQESKTADEVHTEEEDVHPISWYSWTKVFAEKLMMDRIKHYGLKALILRPRQLLSAMVSPRNAITKLLTYDKFIDTPNSCTIVEDLMGVTERLVERKYVGIINVVNPGVTTPYRIAEILKAEIKPDWNFKKITKYELNAMTFAKRVDCVLSGSKLVSMEIKLRPIEERLREIAKEYKAKMETPEGKKVLEITRKETEEKLSIVKNSAE